MKKESVIVDSSTLFNFVKVNRLDILKKLRNYSFRIPYVVIKEFSKGSDRKRLLHAIESKHIKTETMDLAESRISSKLLIPHRLRPMIHEGESPVLAISINRKWKIAIDERAGREIVRREIGGEYIIQTKDLLLEAIKKQIITVETADQIKSELEDQYCFRIKGFKSFRDFTKQLGNLR